MLNPLISMTTPSRTFDPLRLVRRRRLVRRMVSTSVLSLSGARRLACSGVSRRLFFAAR